ncbi:MAG: hypothetical protein MPN21_18295 [Thermoanaerobaculia bacterium]|nr:hypothetical protein [Thermoanaerobaculia bacterium]
MSRLRHEERRTLSSTLPQPSGISDEVQLPLAFPTRLLILGWLIPGLGHVLLGRRARGIAFSVLVLGSLLFGAWLDGRMPWIFSGSPLFILMTFGAMGSGAAYFLLRMSGFTGDPTAWGYDYGGAFIVTAGLMNLLLLLDVHDICWGKELVDPEVADGLRAEPISSEDEVSAGEPSSEERVEQGKTA